MMDEHEMKLKEKIMADIFMGRLELARELADLRAEGRAEEAERNRLQAQKIADAAEAKELQKEERQAERMHRNNERLLRKLESQRWASRSEAAANKAIEPNKKCPKCDKYRVSLNVVCVISIIQAPIIVWMSTLIPWK